MERFTVSDFGGGWNVAEDESVIPSNMSASMMDFTVSETGTLKRRNGYQPVYQPVSATIWAFDMLNTSTGAEYLAIVSGTGFIAGDLVATAVAAVTVEAETLAAGAASMESSGDWQSGGSAWKLTTAVAATLNVPSSNRIGVTFRGNVDASMWIDSAGSILVNATGTTSASFVSAGATTHTLYVKPKLPTSYSLKQGISGTFGCSVYSSRYLSTGVPALGNGVHTLTGWFYDDYSAGEARKARRGFTMAGSSAYYCFAGCDWDKEADVYIIDWEDSQYYKTGVARSTGWHKVKFTFTYWDGAVHADSVQFDDNVSYIYPVEKNLGTQPRLRCNLVSESASTWLYGYYDHITLDDMLFEDFDDDSLWSDFKSGTYTGLTVAVSNEQYKNDVRFFIDTVTYSTEPTWTHLASVSATERIYGMTQTADSIYFASPYNAVRQFNGSTVSTVASTPPEAKYVLEYRRRLWAIGDAGDEMYAYYTETDQPEDWSGGGVRISQVNTGEKCTGFALWNDTLWASSESALYALDVSDATSTNWVAKAVSKAHGCIAPRTFVAAQNGIAFLSAQGVMTYGLVSGMNSGDGSALSNISENIQPKLDTITNWSLPVMAMHASKLWLAVPLSGAAYNTHVLVCDLTKKTKNGQPVWYPYKIPNVTSLKSYSHEGIYALYAGTNKGSIVQLDVGNFDQMTANGYTQTIISWYTIPPLAPGGYESVVHGRHVHLALESDVTQNVVLIPSTDDVSGQTQAGEVNALTGKQPVRFVTPWRGRSIKLTIGCASRSAFNLNSVTFTYNPKPRLR